MRRTIVFGDELSHNTLSSFRIAGTSSYANRSVCEIEIFAWNFRGHFDLSLGPSSTLPTPFIHNSTVQIARSCNKGWAARGVDRYPQQQKCIRNKREGKKKEKEGRDRLSYGQRTTLTPRRSRQRVECRALFYAEPAQRAGQSARWGFGIGPPSEEVDPGLRLHEA